MGEPWLWLGPRDFNASEQVAERAAAHAKAPRGLAFVAASFSQHALHVDAIERKSRLCKRPKQGVL